jgi:hypothetical protein
MELMQAFDVMLGSLTAADASRRQVQGCMDWRALVEAAYAAGRDYCAAAGTQIQPAGREVAGHATPTHRAWLDLCQQIIKTIGAQHQQAFAEMSFWLAEAVRHAKLRDDWLRAAAAADSPQQRAYCLEQAAREERERVNCLALARRAQLWMDAARYAAQFGMALAAREDQINRPVGEAIAAAGGTGEVARARTYHVAGSSR